MAKRTRRQRIEELLENFQAVHRCIASRTGRSTVGLKITPAQWGALMVIGRHDACGVKDVAEALSISSSAATQLVDGLVKNRLVVRRTRAGDRRAVVLGLSQSARRRKEGMRKHVVEAFLDAFKALSDKEFDQYCTLNGKIADSLSQRTHLR